MSIGFSLARWPWLQRHRGWVIFFAIGLAWKVIVLTLGAAIPRWAIGEGVAHLPLLQQATARTAKQAALTLWAHPLERLGIVQALQVVSVEPVPEPDSAAAGPALACRGDRARVRAYTSFAILYSEAVTRCNSGVVEYRFFKRAR